jgi:hypothetical protein
MTHTSLRRRIQFRCLYYQRLRVTAASNYGEARFKQQYVNRRKM